MISSQLLLQRQINNLIFCIYNNVVPGQFMLLVAFVLHEEFDLSNLIRDFALKFTLMKASDRP